MTTAMLEADAKPDSREHPGCKVWRAMAYTVAYAQWEERVQPGPGAHRPGMGLTQGQVCSGRYSMTCVCVFLQAGDSISRTRLRLRGGNHQR